jgi:DNA-binding SARP family transcriptional activator/predicted ATPase
MHLNISVLGSPQVRLGNKLITRFEFERVRALLVYLAVEIDTMHERQSLAYMFCPDASAKIGLQNLRQTLAALRRALQDKRQEISFLITTPSTIAFNPESDYSLDIKDFSRLIKEVGQHKHRRLDVCSICMMQLEQAIRLYREDFAKSLTVDSVPFEEWLLFKREQIHVQVIAALTRLTDYCLRPNRLTEAIQLARWQLALDSLCDIAHHQLIQALAADGRRHAALKHCEQYKSLLAKELKVSLPAKTAVLYQELIAETWAPATLIPSSHHNLPKLMTQFIGYERELAIIHAYLSSAESRLLILTGLVGSGKTQVAIKAAWTEAPNFRDGVYYVELEHVKDGGVLEAIAQVVHPLFEKGKATFHFLAQWLRDKEVLLVLDHFDHLIQSDAAALRSLLHLAPEFHILVTSQERLKLRGETFLSIQGLDYPAKADVPHFITYGAVRFFVQRVQHWQPDFSLTAAEDREAVVRLCQNTGGNPRALELCAYATNFFSLEQMIRQFENPIGIGSPLLNDVPKRQDSLQDMFDYSWQRLSDDERKILISLSVFRANFSLLAAQAITQVHPSTLLTLHAKSWLQLRCSGQLQQTEKADDRQKYLPSTCYRIPNLFHLYTWPALQQEPDLMRTLQRTHAIYYMNFLRQHMDRLVNGQYQSWILKAVRHEIENIEQAWGWAIDSDSQDIRAQIEHHLSLFYIFENGRQQDKTTSVTHQLAYIHQDESPTRLNPEWFTN